MDFHCSFISIGTRAIVSRNNFISLSFFLCLLLLHCPGIVDGQLNYKSPQNHHQDINNDLWLNLIKESEYDYDKTKYKQEEEEEEEKLEKQQELSKNQISHLWPTLNALLIHTVAYNDDDNHHHHHQHYNNNNNNNDLVYDNDENGNAYKIFLRHLNDFIKITTTTTSNNNNNNEVNSNFIFKHKNIERNSQQNHQQWRPMNNNNEQQQQKEEEEEEDVDDDDSSYSNRNRGNAVGHKSKRHENHLYPCLFKICNFSRKRREKKSP